MNRLSSVSNKPGALQLTEILSEDDQELYPSGKGDAASDRQVKGSVALERLFAAYELRYNKRTGTPYLPTHPSDKPVLMTQAERTRACR